ncbi:MAG: cytochrome c oxidase subunit II, partial [Pseudomonadales bacterium]
MTFGIILILIVVGSILFHFLSPWGATPLASNWGTIDDTLVITTVITGIFFVAINIFMAYAVIRFRHRGDGRRAAYEPENKKLEWWLIAITTVGVCGLLAPGLVVYAHFVNVPEEADVFEAHAQQWQWTFRFPGEDGQLGTADVKFMSFDNPFGLNPGDPNGQDDVLIQNNELHLPIDRPVKALLRSKDVLHDFYVPQFRAKMDIVPGLVSYMWFTPTKTGTYEILCAEYCGTGHYNMRGLVVVDEQADFE